MSHDDTDYNIRGSMNLNDFLPEVNRERIVEYLNKNTLNRFLTKPEYDFVSGYVGEHDPDSELNKIPERTEYRDENQLQPIIHAKVAEQDRYMTFQDFLRKLEREGVDTTSLDQWGKTQSFNWVPPINIDKLINYQDYYWTDKSTKPQYITIENECTRISAIFDESKRITYDRTPDENVRDIDDLTGLATGNIVLARTIEETLYLLKYNGSSFEPLNQNLDISDEEFIDYVELYVDIQEIRTEIDSFEIDVLGDYSTGSYEGVVGSVITDQFEESQFIKYADVIYDEDEDITTFSVDKSLRIFSSEPTKLCLQYKPLIELYHSMFKCGELREYDEYSWYSIGQYLTTNLIEIYQNTVASIPWSLDMYSKVGRDYFVDTDGNFNDLLNNNREYKVEVLVGNNRGLYDLVGFTNDTLYIDGRLMLDTSMVYRILYVTDSENILVEPDTPMDGEPLYDKGSDTLYRYENGHLEVIAYDVKHLYDVVSIREKYTENVWTEQNKWVHKNQLEDFSGTSKAAMPIIEYENYLELSEASRVVYKWEYSPAPNEEYIESTQNPSLLELKPIELDGNITVVYDDNETISIIGNVGNLEEHLKEGDVLTLDGFDNNNGNYVVEGVEFEIDSNGDIKNTITFTNSLPDTADAPLGAIIYLNETSVGDTYILDYPHWKFAGIKTIEPTSEIPEDNPLLDVFVEGGVIQDINPSYIGTLYQAIVGKTWFEASLTASINAQVSGMEIDFPEGLRDICLYEDYQEGDIRIYLNGERIYGGFTEKTTNGIYVNSIKFDDDITIYREDRIRIELGEAYLKDVGLREVEVYTSDDLEYTTELFNLVSHRKIEQAKEIDNEYPLFRLYDVFGTPWENANQIFSFTENNEYALNPHILKRIEYFPKENEYNFTQHLLKPDGEKLLCFKNINTLDKLQSIWRPGKYNEVQIPKKIDDEWDITNSWEYNIKHENRDKISLREIYQHFSTIISSQNEPEHYTESGIQRFHAIENPNYGLGGTIKEHNDNLDVLSSLTFQDHSNVLDIIRFARQLYNIQLLEFEEYYLKNIVKWLKGGVTNISEELLDYIKNYSRYDQLFGDSSTYDGESGTGIKNFIATQPILGIIPATKPMLYEISGILNIRHHDGHERVLAFSPNTLLGYLQNKVDVREIISNNQDPLPDETLYDSGDTLLRINKNDKIIEFYILDDNDQWELVNLDEIYGEALLSIENILYEESLKKIPKRYDFTSLENEQYYKNIEEEYFTRYCNDNFLEDALDNKAYDPNNPWTWNYAYSTISSDPLNQSSDTLNIGSWQAMYEHYYGTSIPNIEPWKLQGYINKPSWWDTEYENSLPNLDRVWSEAMWDNILTGTVPTGRSLPNGIMGDGTPNQVTVYQYIPVVSEDSATADGYEPDELLPPYWDSSNSNKNETRSLFERGIDTVISPEEPFIFGQKGYCEWEWRKSIYYNYDRLSIAYRTDPQKLIHRIMGREYVNVDCLQVDTVFERVYTHEDTVFHGDLDGDGNVHYSEGFLQWFTHFSRYHGYDGVPSNYTELWKGWDIVLGYAFDNVINSKTFDIRSDTLDLTDRDYDLGLKKTEGIDSFWFQSLRTELLRTPSHYIEDRPYSRNWVTKVIANSIDNRELNYYHPENYPFQYLGNDEFGIYHLELLNAGIDLPKVRSELYYNMILSTDLPVAYNSNQQYTTSFDLNGDNITLIVDGSNVDTVGEVIMAINSQLPVEARLTLEGGVLVFVGNISNLSEGANGIFNNLVILGGSYNYTQNTTTYEFTGYFEVSLKYDNYFDVGDRVDVINSLNFTGEYQIIRKSLDIPNNVLRIYVTGNANVISTDIDGYIIPTIAKEIPWEDGQEVHFDTNGILPDSLERGTPYYIIKTGDYTFQVAETKTLASSGTHITFNGGGVGEHTIGRLRYTFKPLDGKEYDWYRYYTDNRTVLTIHGSSTFSGLQAMADLAFGYDDYLTDLGIETVNDRLDNVDESTGRGRDWQLMVDKFINWAYKQRTIKNRRGVLMKGTLDNDGSLIKITNSSSTWPTGTGISIVGYEGVLPPELSSEISNIFPYYVIATNQKNVIQLARNRRDAHEGKFIKFTGAGVAEVTLRNFRPYDIIPKKTLNPYKKQVKIIHDMGLPSNFMKGFENSTSTMQRMYSEDLKGLTVSDLLFYRQDKNTLLQMVKDKPDVDIGGGYIVLDGMEHVIVFNSYNTDGGLIYDPFLGIRTPRFFLEFVKPSGEHTQRPTLSGLILHDGDFQDSIEKGITDLRYLYDNYYSIENDDTTTELRKSIGYEGRKDYMDSLGLGSKSQFIYWLGYIHSKGTLDTLNAFSNHRLLNNISVDEFWAYRLCEFGSSGKKVYPEMKLFTDDVVRTELRLEFTPPTGGIVENNFKSIRLVDRDRWNKQPEIIESMYPDQAYYFNVEMLDVLENVENDWREFEYSSAAQYTGFYYELPLPTPSIEVYYKDSDADGEISDDKFKRAYESVDFDFVNYNLVRFYPHMEDKREVTIHVLSYSYDEDNPSKVIDRGGLNNKVITDVPIWHPKLEQHNPIAKYVVDDKAEIDPAKYNMSVDGDGGDGNYWSKEEVGRVWFDDILQDYVPYYDEKVYPSIDDRSMLWGRLSECGDVALYQWVESIVPPEKYNKPDDWTNSEHPLYSNEEQSGKVKENVYLAIKDVRDEITGWVEDRPVLRTISFLNISNDAYAFEDFEPYYELYKDLGRELVLEVYINGKYLMEVPYSSIQDWPVGLVITLVNARVTEKDHITFVKPTMTPTEEDLDSGFIKKYIPHTRVKRYNPLKKEEYYVYYFWVRDVEHIKTLDNTLTLKEAERGLIDMTDPYMFIEGYHRGEEGYGVIFGSTFDPDDANLPPRYTRCVVKGLQNTAKDNDRYVLRFTKDETLRDKLLSKRMKQNKHVEWKLFREKQPFKIDERLWKKVIESAVGYNLDGDYNIIEEEKIPSLERETYDAFYPFNTRIGLGSEQVLLDKDKLIKLLVDIFTDPTHPLESVEEPDVYIQQYDLDRRRETIEFLREVYNSFTTKDVNWLFFQVLIESMENNPEHADFFKTSWVSIDVSAHKRIFPTREITIPDVYDSDYCFLNIQDEDGDGNGEDDHIFGTGGLGINAREINSAEINR